MPAAPEVLQTIVNIAEEVTDDTPIKLAALTGSMPVRTNRLHRRNHQFGANLTSSARIASATTRIMNFGEEDVSTNMTTGKLSLPPIRSASARATSPTTSVSNASIYRGIKQKHKADAILTTPATAYRSKMFQKLATEAKGAEQPTGEATAEVTEKSIHPWGQTSVGDLESLDTILDQLVVLHTKMRSALLAGPLVSFETKFPTAKQERSGLTPELDALLRQLRAEQEDRNPVFLTGLQLEEELPSGEQPSPSAADETAAASPTAMEPIPPMSPTKPISPKAPSTLALSAAQMVSGQVAAKGPWDTGADGGLVPLPGVPPMLPPARLVRMALAARAAPQAPAVAHPILPQTADHLLRTRPPPFILAPSYDELCLQIRDVQRQYTCGTAGHAAIGNRDPSPQRQQTTINQYISGLDGPTLEEVVSKIELPPALENPRYSFVSLRNKGAPRKSSPQRVWGVYDGPLEEGYWSHNGPVPPPDVAISWDRPRGGLEGADAKVTTTSHAAMPAEKGEGEATGATYTNNAHEDGMEASSSRLASDIGSVQDPASQLASTSHSPSRPDSGRTPGEANKGSGQEDPGVAEDWWEDVEETAAGTAKEVEGAEAQEEVGKEEGEQEEVVVEESGAGAVPSGTEVAEEITGDQVGEGEEMAPGPTLLSSPAPFVAPVEEAEVAATEEENAS